MCEHEYEVEGEILEITFDEYDMAEVVEKKCWLCYDCREVISHAAQENSYAQQDGRYEQH